MFQRAAVVTAMGTAFILIGTSIKSGWLYLAASALFSLVIVGILSGWWATRGITIMREAPANAFDGEPVPVALHMRNDARLRRFFMVVRDPGWGRGWGRGTGKSRRIGFESVAPGETAIARYELGAPGRGVYPGKALAVSSGGAFGVGQFSRKHPVGTPLIVYPSVHYLESFPFEAVATVTPVENKEWVRQGVDRDFFGVREYVRGDALKDVHWKSSARQGKLIIREYQREFKPYAGIVIAVEGPPAGKARRGAGSGTETALSAAASIFNYYDLAGASVVIVSLSGEEAGAGDDLLKDSATAASFNGAFRAGRGGGNGTGCPPSVLFEPSLQEGLEHMARYLPPHEGAISRGPGKTLRPPLVSAVICAAEALPAGSLITIVSNIGAQALAFEISLLSIPNRIAVVAVPEELFGKRVPEGAVEAGREALLGAAFPGTEIYMLTAGMEAGECLKRPLSGTGL